MTADRDFAAEFLAARITARTSDSFRTAALADDASERILRDAERAGVEFDAAALDEQARARYFALLSDDALLRAVRDPSQRSLARAEITRRAER